MNISGKPTANMKSGATNMDPEIMGSQIQGLPTQKSDPPILGTSHIYGSIQPLGITAHSASEPKFMGPGTTPPPFMDR